MPAVYVLFAIVITSAGGGAYRPVTLQQEFFSEAACVKAMENIRAKAQNARIDLLTCEKK